MILPGDCDCYLQELFPPRLKLSRGECWRVAVSPQLSASLELWGVKLYCGVKTCKIWAAPPHSQATRTTHQSQLTGDLEKLTELGEFYWWFIMCPTLQYWNIFSSRIPTSSPLGDPASTAALLGLHSRPELPPSHPLSPTYLALHSSPTSSLRLPSHADYLSAAATAHRLGELQQAAQASLDVPFSLDGE